MRLLCVAILPSGIIALVFTTGAEVPLPFFLKDNDGGTGEW